MCICYAKKIYTSSISESLFLKKTAVKTLLLQDLSLIYWFGNACYTAKVYIWLKTLWSFFQPIFGKTCKCWYQKLPFWNLFFCEYLWYKLQSFFCSKRPINLKNKNGYAKTFLQIYFVQNVYYPQKVCTSATKL